jgi:hypothetical protein
VLYGNALLVYHVYCDLNGPIPDHEQCPISRTLLLAFLSSCAGGASGSTLSNYVAGIKAWHLLHSQSWNIHQDELCLTLQGAARLAPRNSICAKRPPVTIDDLKIIRANLNMNDPGDAAVYACTVITFYCIPRLGEFTVPNVREKFEPMKYISRRDIFMLKDKDGLPVIKFRIPVTKCDPSGEDVQCAPQSGCVTDPETALQNHLRLNPAPPNAHLFAWKHPRSGLRPLSKMQVMNKLVIVAKQNNLADLKGHSLCIGGTLFYLLKGVPFDVVKVIGHWAGEAFTLYLRDHVLILALFLQANQQLFNNFMRVAVPPVR